MRKHTFKIILIIGTILLHVGCDRVSKNLASAHLQGAGRIEVIGDFFVLQYIENRGAFLGMGSDLPDVWRSLLLSWLPALMIVAVIIYAFREEELTMVQLLSLTAIAGGGIGNLYDRFFNDSHVIDFLNFGIGSLRTGILNVADLSITFGCIVLAVTVFQAHKEQKEAANQLSENDSANGS